MSEKKGSLPREPYTMVKERLSSTNTELTSFYFPPGFQHGGNIYVFSYEKEGVRRHTFVDAGDLRNRKRILSILAENDIKPANIERIIITHRHPDHCGLAALLAKEAKAKILAHSSFRSFVEEEIEPEERRWLGELNPSQLKECDIEYLAQSDPSARKSINGVDFPILGEPVEIGEGARLQILACPESTPTHIPGQIIVLYSPNNCPQTPEKGGGDFRPTDDILFAGDLWLMTGPFTTRRRISHAFYHLRYAGFRLKNLISGKAPPRRDPREQDSIAKEALKTGFSLIRVKPGHGTEFIGSQIIPRSLLADRDLLVALGYPLNADQSILQRGDSAPRVAALREQAYASFVEELLFWRELGYTLSEVSELLVRIYKEQVGGGKLVQQDRKQRRERLKATLARLKDDEAQSEELQQLAKATLLALQGV